MVQSLETKNLMQICPQDQPSPNLPNYFSIKIIIMEHTQHDVEGGATMSLQYSGFNWRERLSRESLKWSYSTTVFIEFLKT